jgi:hypothetical protein
MFLLLVLMCVLFASACVSFVHVDVASLRFASCSRFVSAAADRDATRSLDDDLTTPSRSNRRDVT